MQGVGESWIGRFVITVLWPWFKKHVWPIIEAFLLALLADILAFMRERMNEWWQSRQERQERARERAEEAESKAETADDEAEKREYEAVARVWREVADEMRQENERLSDQIDALLKEAELRGRKQITEVEPMAIASRKGILVKVGNEERVVEKPGPESEIPTLPASVGENVATGKTE